jgi:hypothetical protein
VGIVALWVQLWVVGFGRERERVVSHCFNGISAFVCVCEGEGDWRQDYKRVEGECEKG